MISIKSHATLFKEKVPEPGAKGCATSAEAGTS
jgi:hypothetical protein